MKKTAIITGATSGIGMATSNILAKLGFDCIITGRRKDRLEEQEKQLKTTYGIDVLSLTFDIRNQQQTLDAIQTIPEEWKNVKILINNAGLAAGVEKVDDATWEKWEQMIDTNIKGLLFFSKEIIKMMVANKSGHIINLSSIAGINVYEGGSVYCATKHAVNAITQGMRIDLLKHNIKVSSVSPGMVETEFSMVRYDGDKAKADNVYAGVVPLSAQDIAETIEFIVTRPPHVNINDILIMPTQQANAYYTHRRE